MSNITAVGLKIVYVLKGAYSSSSSTPRSCSSMKLWM